MNIGCISTRLAGTDGVSLENGKLARVLERMGRSIYYCAGELAPGLPGLEAPELHFTDPVAVDFGRKAFGNGATAINTQLLDEIGIRARQLLLPLRQFVDQYEIDCLIIQNAFAIPMQLPLAQALTDLLRETQLPALAHNHDFYWERNRFSDNCIQPFLDTYFPPALPNLSHAVINSLAQSALKSRCGLDSVLLPNVFDFEIPPPGIDDYNFDFRRAIGISDDDLLILQPTRVVPRKGIELAIELVAQLDEPRAKLVITHNAGDEGYDYLRQLQRMARRKHVDLLYVANVIATERDTSGGGKLYSLWDAYPHADFVTYPSLIEGFGNGLLETIYFKRPALVNRYPVFVADIAPKGFRFIEIDGAVTSEAVSAVRYWLANSDVAAKAAKHNYDLACRHYSFDALENVLSQLFPVA